jgi:hypothetical protein
MRAQIATFARAHAAEEIAEDILAYLVEQKREGQR